MSLNDTSRESEDSLLSRMFRRGSKADAAETTSMTSEEPLHQKQPMKSSSQEEHAAFQTLMAKAKTMSQEDFKKYLKEHQEGVEEMYRKQGGGIAGGEWIDSSYTTGLNP